MLNPFKSRRLLAVDVKKEFAETQNTLKMEAATFEDVTDKHDFRILHTVEGGIERVHFLPHKPNGMPPLLMMHGMWHSAFCWRGWQEAMASEGWESIAFSLPGHGRSPVQRPVAECSLPYYLRFLVDEVARLEQAPVLIGHSMGGALVQWYLRYAGDLPAMVFVASWTSHDILKDS